MMSARKENEQVFQAIYIYINIYIQKSLVIHERNAKQISTMTVTLYLIKLIDVRKNTNEHRILYKIVILISN